MDECNLIFIEDGADYYQITCDSYVCDMDSPYIKELDDVNMIRTGFRYSVKNVGWGAGYYTDIHAQDVENVYQLLKELRVGCIEKLSYSFNNPGLTQGYYFKVIILRINDHYNAYFRIYDDLDVVEMWKTFTEEELDQQVEYFKNCVKEYQVRYRPNE